MTTLNTRTTSLGIGVTAKGSPLTNEELDLNFISLNDNKVEQNSSAELTYAVMDPTASASAPDYAEGTLYYDSDAKTLQIYGATSSFNISVGEREWVRCRNTSAGTIFKGQPVYVTGVHIPGHPVHGHHPTIDLASATDINAKDVLGLAAEDIAVNDHGYVIVRGYIEDVDTSAFESGRRIHLGATSGTLTQSAPDYPYYPMDLGICLTASSTGTLYVNIFDHAFERLRVTEGAYIDGDLVVGGSFTTLNSGTVVSLNSINLADDFIYLGAGDQLTSTFTGAGLNDLSFKGHYESGIAVTYYVLVDSTGTTDTFTWGYDSSFATVEASGVNMSTSVVSLAAGIGVEWVAATGHTSGDVWSAAAVPFNTDFGIIGNYTSGAAYTHAGLFRDSADNAFKLFERYDPEIDTNIDTTTGNYTAAQLDVKRVTFAGDTVKLGTSAGETNQGNNSIAMGYQAGQYDQAQSSVAIGARAGESYQGSQSVAVGQAAALTGQLIRAVAVGFSAGRNDQGDSAVAIGDSAGQTDQGTSSIAIGARAGQSYQSSSAIAIGWLAGNTSQLTRGIAIGAAAGQIIQGADSIAMGYQAGNTNQGPNCVSIGYLAGQTNQASTTGYATAIGRWAGQTDQGDYGIALGRYSGNLEQGYLSLALGDRAGQDYQGTNAVAIGYSAGRHSQSSYSIVINATGAALNSPATSSLTIKPIRDVATNSAYHALAYDTSTGEVVSLPQGINSTTSILRVTGTSYTVPGNLVAAQVICVGAGGGGGAGDSADTAASNAGAGGGAGGTAIRFYSKAELGTTCTYAIGAAGTASAGGAANTGGTGGTTSFTPGGTGTALSSTGGSGGQGVSSGATSNSSNGGNGGTGSGGTFNISGADGQPGISYSTDSIGGNGGGSYFGGGGRGATQQAAGATAGTAAATRGAGGGGGASLNSNATSNGGGAGASGAVYIVEYLR